MCGGLTVEVGRGCVVEFFEGVEVEGVTVELGRDDVCGGFMVELGRGCAVEFLVEVEVEGVIVEL